jgi:tricorn protease
MPALHGHTLVFAAEGDLWRVGIQGGAAERLTSHPADENSPAISPDGKRVAFSAAYEGPGEAYVMPVEGGLPERITFEGGGVAVVGWTPDGRVLYRTRRYSTLPNAQLCAIDPKTRAMTLLPLAQASDGAYDETGNTLFFTRLGFQGSATKRYKGGTAQNLWKWAPGMPEAAPLTGDFAGTSRSPMWYRGRVYFLSDRDGVMNVWSMKPEGGDLKQHTHHADYDVQSPSLSDGRVVYQHGADLWLLDLATGKTAPISVRLTSDYDQMRERWVKKPMDWVTSVALSPKGDRVALTARGQVFVAPVEPKPGRMVEVTRRAGVRYRDARFLPDGKSLVALSDESGEVELWKLSASGDASGPKPEQLTRGGDILRWRSLPSPDGKYIAHTDKKFRLWLYDVATKQDRLVATSENYNIDDLEWSPDSRWLAYVFPTPNLLGKIRLYSVETGTSVDATTDRYQSYSPAFSPDGKFLYFLSDRRFESKVGGPWGSRQPEPYFENQTRVYSLALKAGTRSPFRPDDELTAEEKEAKEAAAKEAKPDDKKPDADKKPEGGDGKPKVEMDTAGLAGRLEQVPVPVGDYGNLTTDGRRLFFLASTGDGPPSLQSIEIKGDSPKVTTVTTGVTSYELSADRKKLLVRKGTDLFVFDAGPAAPGNLAEARVNLDGWMFPLDPREEWRQMFTEAWRLHRDYFYAPTMLGTDWAALREKYRPLVDRVTTREELSDVLAQMVGELSTLHTFVYGGDSRPGTDSIPVATLGAAWTRDEKAGGYRITRVYRTDPDEPDALGPLLRPGVNVKEGDVIAQVNGVPTLSVPDAAALLRNQSGKQVRLRVLPDGVAGLKRDVIIIPVPGGREYDLRYADWEFSRRQQVEKLGGGTLAYVHLRAMGSEDIAQWQRDYYPVFDRQGLIVDVRHNQGGNIDSWILEKLLRKAWMFWKPPVGAPYWNMQYAFRGPVVVLCDEWTSSDGEAFAEGFRRLGLGKVIGTRTWGGEVWLTSSNRLVDNGIATAAEFGVYGPEGSWLIEGRGVEPDIVVDNLPRATFDGRDAQLEAAVRYLQAEIKKKPVTVPAAPAYPDLSFPPRKEGK